MKKSFLSKLEELKPQVPVHLEIERKLIPRLKFMGYVMCTLSLAAFVFALVVKEDEVITRETIQKEETSNSAEIEAVSPLLTDDAELELAPTEVLNFYLVSLIFAAVSASCFVIAWKKRKTLYAGPQVTEE
jgi:hypothetical protein